MITTQRELRRLFWQEHEGVPGISRKRIPNYSGNGTMHNTDTRCAWCDWLDACQKGGLVSEKLAERATL